MLLCAVCRTTFRLFFSPFVVDLFGRLFFFACDLCVRPCTVGIRAQDRKKKKCLKLLFPDFFFFPLSIETRDRRLACTCAKSAMQSNRKKYAIKEARRQCQKNVSLDFSLSAYERHQKNMRRKQMRGTRKKRGPGGFRRLSHAPPFFPSLGATGLFFVLPWRCFFFFLSYVFLNFQNEKQKQKRPLLDWCRVCVLALIAVAHGEKKKRKRWPPWSCACSSSIGLHYGPVGPVLDACRQARYRADHKVSNEASSTAPRLIRRAHKTGRRRAR